MISMAHTDPLPAPGSTVQATIAGRGTTLVIERYSHGMVHTNDWRVWWCGQPGHTDGTRITGGTDQLHLTGYGQLVLVHTQDLAA